MAQGREYLAFYESLGRFYPETSLVHSYRGITSRYLAVIRALKPFAEQGSLLLDAGCNDGVYMIPYCRMGGAALGIDIASTLLARARELSIGLPTAAYLRADICNWSARPIFDLVLMADILEHVSQPDQALTNARTLLKPGGHLLISTPTPLMEIKKSESLARRLFPLDRRYVRDLLSRKLSESQFIETSKTILRGYLPRTYSYRHDAFYPTGLSDYVEGFGFECVRLSTIRAVQRLPGVFWRCTEPSFKFLEIARRKLPFLSMLGETTIGLFKLR